LLAAVHIALDGLSGHPDSPASIQHIHDLLDRVEAQLRRLSRELRPTILDDLGLGPALQWMGQRTAERTGLPIAVDVATLPRLTGVVETAAYRITQEAVTNAVRHARASMLAITAGISGGWLNITIRDNGAGFDAAATLARRGDRGLGLLGMQERVDALGGTLQITSQQDAGTCLMIRLPIDGTP